jgi:hypothetical protein
MRLDQLFLKEDSMSAMEKDLIDMYKGDGEPGLADAMGMSEREFAKEYVRADADIYKMIKNFVAKNKSNVTEAKSPPEVINPTKDSSPADLKAAIKYAKYMKAKMDTDKAKATYDKEIAQLDGWLKKKSVMKENENDTTVKTMSMPEKVSAFDRLQSGQEIGLWFDSVIRRADKYKPFVVGRKTKSNIRPIEKITLLQKSKDGGTGGMKYYLYKRNGDNVSLAMGDMAASLVDIKEAKAYDINEADATIMERIVLDIDYSRNPDALIKAINAMARRLDLTLMNAPQSIKDLKEKGFAKIEGKDADIMSFVNYLYSKGIEPTYNIQGMDKVQTPGLNANPNMPAFIGKKKEPATTEAKATAGPDKCWPGYKKVGTKPGTGKNKGKTVNDCKKA